MPEHVSMAELCMSWVGMLCPKQYPLVASMWILSPAVTTWHLKKEKAGWFVRTPWKVKNLFARIDLKRCRDPCLSKRMRSAWMSTMSPAWTDCHEGSRSSRDKPLVDIPPSFSGVSSTTERPWAENSSLIPVYWLVDRDSPIGLL